MTIEINDYPLLTNILVALFTLLPLFIMLYYYKSMQPKYYGLFLWGGALIVWSALCFGELNNAVNLMNSSSPNNHTEETLKNNIISVLQVWLYIMPAITAAIGANLITQFLLSKKPNA